MATGEEAGPKPGDVLAGKYRVERVLGSGGMGVVVAAHHIHLDEKVALKFLLPDGAHTPEATSRFIREARAAAKIKNEHVARVTDVGHLENGVPYIVMEYLEGHDLASWPQRRGAMPIERAVDFVLQACEALADAHSLGIVHRDLKPANLFCVQRSDGQLAIKVLDFGISKISAPGTPGDDMTRTTALLGSPYYMSPEHMKLAKGVDARTDIWSLGIILFELLTQRRPFDAEGLTELAIKVANDPAPAVRELRRDVPVGLEQVIAKCLEKDRRKRFQTVGELAVALRDFAPKDARVSVERVLRTLRAETVSGAPAPPSGDLPLEAGLGATLRENVPQTAASWGGTGAGNRSRGRAALGIGVALVLGLIALAGARLLHKAGPADAAPTASAGSVPPVQAPAVASAPPGTGLPVVEETSAPIARASGAPPSEFSPTASPRAVPNQAVASPAASGRSTGAPSQRPTLSAATTARPPLVTAVPATPKANCNPPFTFDANGTKVWKPECF